MISIFLKGSPRPKVSSFNSNLGLHGLIPASGLEFHPRCQRGAAGLLEENIYVLCVQEVLSPLTFNGEYTNWTSLIGRTVFFRQQEYIKEFQK